jgi:hypothetical protein
MEALKTVLSGFIGIRRKADAERAPVHPAQIIIVALVAVVLFVLTLVTIVRFVAG